MQPRHGQVLWRRFELAARLGPRRADATTWRARGVGDTPSGVLKLARAGTAAGNTLEREGALLAHIPAAGARAVGLPPLVGQGRDEGWTWLLLEDMGEEDLGRAWAGRRVPRDEVLAAGRDVARALAFLHEHGVVHRDVKEQNIVVDRRGGRPRYRLVDLGISRTLDGRTSVTVDLGGSHARIAPEQSLPGARVGPPADVFVLCKVLVEALAAPEAPPPPPRLAKPEGLARLGLDPARPREVELAELLAAGLSLDPAQRPTASHLAHALGDEPERRPLRRRLLGTLALLTVTGVAPHARPAADRVGPALAAARAELEQGDVDEALDILGHAWLEARGPGRRAALVALGETLAAAWRWEDLARALGHLGESPLSEPALAERVARLERSLAAARANPAAGQADPTLLERYLSHAVPAGRDGEDQALADLSGDGQLALLRIDADHALTWTDDPLATPAPLPGAPPNLERVFAVDLPPPQPDLLVLQWDHVDDGPAALFRPEAGSLVQVSPSWIGGETTASLLTDLDDDGDLDILLAEASRTRRLRGLVNQGDRYGLDAPHLGLDLDGGHSDFVDLLPGPTVGLPPDEVVVAASAWAAYDVRSLRLGSPSTLTWRQRLGPTQGLVALGPDTLGVVKLNTNASPAALSPDHPLGVVPGLHRFVRDGGGFTWEGMEPAPMPVGWGQDLRLGDALQADLDGDGADEIIISLGLRETPGTWVLGGPAGRGEQILILGYQARAILPGDPPTLLVASGDDQLWAVGRGDEPLPTPTTASTGSRSLVPPYPPSTAPGSQALADARALFGMGLAETAAGHLEALLDTLPPTAEDRSLLALEAGRLRESAGQHTAAARLFDRAAQAPTLAGTALLDAAHSYAAALDLTAAITRTEQALASPGLGPFEREAASRQRTVLEALARPEGGRTASWAGGWQHPATLGDATDSQSVQVRGVGQLPVLAVLPVRPSGDAVELVAELDVRRAEWWTGMDIELVEAGEAGKGPHYTVRFLVDGGGGQLLRQAGCRIGDHAVGPPVKWLATAGSADHLRLRLVVIPELNQASCEVTRMREGEPPVTTRRTETTSTRIHRDRPLELRVRGRVGTLPGNALDLTVRSIELRGLAPRDKAGPPPVHPPSVEDEARRRRTALGPVRPESWRLRHPLSADQAWLADLERDPDHRHVLDELLSPEARAWSRLRHATILVDDNVGDWREAITVATRALDAAGVPAAARAGLLTRRGRAHLQLGETQAALDDLESAGSAAEAALTTDAPMDLAWMQQLQTTLAVGQVEGRMALGQYEEALAEAEAAINRAPVPFLVGDQLSRIEGFRALGLAGGSARLQAALAGYDLGHIPLAPGQD